LTLVVVGGVVSTVLLRTRNSTQDVDFFMEPLSERDARLLGAASQDVSERSRNPRFGAGWLNNNTMVFIAGEIRARLARDSLAQDTVVFERPGLKLVAAPWVYQFCAKLDRMAGGGGRGHDVGDAASYLFQFFRGRNAGRVPASHVWTVSRAQVLTWLEEYGLERPNKSTRGFQRAIDNINNEYTARRYGQVPPITG
jgi:hypothetical protein